MVRARGFVPFAETTLEGTVFHTIAWDGRVLSGEAVVGAVFPGRLDRRPAAVRIDGIRRGDDEVRYYRVSYLRDGRWLPYCGRDAAGAPVEAIPLRGVWDHRQGVPGGGAKLKIPGAFTFACRGGAIAKCVEKGYRPWDTVRVCGDNGCREVSLEAHHQACTRMIRADYCGDGRSWTVNGRLINLYDEVGVQYDTQHYAFEAEWGTGGARCVRRQRVLFRDRGTPECLERLLKADCGDRRSFASGTLLMNEHEEQLIR